MPRDLSTKLAEMLQARRMTRRDVIDRFGAISREDPAYASRATVNRWFAGRALPTIYQLLELSRFFVTSVDFLADRDATVEPPPPGSALQPEQKQLLWLADQVGVEEAIRRILAVRSDAPRAADLDGASRPRSSRTRGSGKTAS